jgi:adenylate kinase
MSTPNGFRLLLFGPPGAGKGTQAERLSAKLRVPHISTGEILRAEVSRGSALGLRARDAMERGELVTDDLMLDLVQSRLHQSDCDKGFILDGFPRSIGQAVGFEESCGFDAAT